MTFGLTTCRNARSKSSGSSDAPCSRAASMNRSRWGFSSGAGGLRAGMINLTEFQGKTEEVATIGEKIFANSMAMIPLIRPIWPCERVLWSSSQNANAACPLCSCGKTQSRTHTARTLGGVRPGIGGMEGETWRMIVVGNVLTRMNASI